ncbi:MAG: peptidoglycan DD-metalloendopeptidase family protein [Clostridium sp.]|uniref:peptidoglycan DD-metalloendopeptidase family protein n=1 Tax=Clostridium sp. TaxID=1506 RepID=UPI0039E898AB
MKLRNKHRTVKGLILIISTISFCVFSYCRTMAFENTTNSSFNQVDKTNNISTEKNSSTKNINGKNKSASKNEKEIPKDNIEAAKKSKVKEITKVSNSDKVKAKSEPKPSPTNVKEDTKSAAKVSVNNIKSKEVAVNSHEAAENNKQQVALLVLPANGRISSFFGYRKVKLNNGTVEAGVHEGIDIAVPLGTKIGAAMSGEVEFVGVQEGYGNVIILRHAGGLETVYAHCSKIEVNKGDKVNTGDEIGKAGSTGRSTGPHIHFEVRLNGTAVDPLKYLNNNVVHN